MPEDLIKFCDMEFGYLDRKCQRQCPVVSFVSSDRSMSSHRLGNLVYKGLTIQAVSYVEGLNYNLLSISQFCDKGYSLEFCKDMASLKNISTNEVILTGKRIRNIYEVMWDNVKEACLISKDKDEEVNEGDRMKPTEFIPFRSLPLKTSQRNLDSDSAEPSENFGQPSNIPDLSNGDNSGNGEPVPIHPETPTTSILQPEAELNQPVNPNQHNLRWLRDHPPQQVIGDIQSGVRTRSAQQNLEAMLACFISQVVGANVHFQKLEAKCSSPTFFQSYLEMIATQELSEFLQMEIRLKIEEEVLEFYRNGEVKTAHSKKNPQRTFPVIKSTVGGSKVKLRLPNSGVEIGKFPAKNLDWNIIGISGQIPSGPTKEADLNNDYKLVLELVIACLECGSGGHADDITQERAFIINSLITKTKLYYDWRAWKVGNSAEQLMDWDQQLKNEKIIKKCLGLPVNHNCEEILDDYWVWQRNHEDLHLEYLDNSPISEFEVDDEDPSVYKPVFSKATKEQVVLTSEAQAVLEATAEDFQTFPETSPAFETETSPAFQETSHASKMVLTEAIQEKVASSPQEQNQKPAEEEESQQLIQSQALEILTTPCEISNPTETEIPEKLAEILEQSTFPETNEEEQAVEVQEIEQMEVRYTQLIEKSEEKHSADLKEISKSVHKTLEIISLLSKTVSNTMEIYASDSQLQLKEINNVKEQIASVIVNLQKQMSLLQMDIRSALAVASANQVVTKDYLKVIIDNQKEAHKLFRLLGAKSGNRKMEVILQQHSPSLIPELPIAVKEGEVSYIPSHLNMTNLILEAQQRNPENSAQHLSSSGLDGTEAIGTVAAHFSNDNQTEERRNNIRRIKELCGNMQGISEAAGSSKRKKN
ncbi:unnamed protein product [Cuscuta campestris]|uniref:Uncharacterized protein n=1 Tax=Cuscuta campestris TaxID=132261 RepID=A0A484KNY1_9ASTE|nr:unnamed protein product [Cuscuta campestris]